MNHKFPPCVYRVSAKAAVIVEGKLLLVQEGPADGWELPGGGIDHGETTEEALYREIGEEVGGTVVDIDRSNIHTWTLHNPENNADYLFIIYPATLAEPPTATEYDGVKIGWFSKEEVQTLKINSLYEPHRQNLLKFFN